MKTKIIIAALAVFIGAGSFYAGNGETLFRRKVSSSIRYPELRGEKVETEVFVQFTVQENGHITIDSVTSGNETIKESIVRQLEALKTSPNDKDVIGKTFYYRFVFKVQ